MTPLLIITGLLVAAASVAAIFTAWKWHPATGYAGLVITFIGAPGVGTPGLLIFWGIAAVLAAGINLMLPTAIAKARTGVAYMTAAAVAGLMVGLLTGAEWMVFGAAIGAILGAISFARTPTGRDLGFPSRKFFNYLCAKAIPAVVTISLAGYAILISIEAYKI